MGSRSSGARGGPSSIGGTLRSSKRDGAQPPDLGRARAPAGESGGCGGGPSVEQPCDAVLGAASAPGQEHGVSSRSRRGSNRSRMAAFGASAPWYLSWVAVPATPGRHPVQLRPTEPADAGDAHLSEFWSRLESWCRFTQNVNGRRGDGVATSFGQMAPAPEMVRAREVTAHLLRSYHAKRRVWWPAPGKQLFSAAKKRLKSRRPGHKRSNPL